MKYEVAVISAGRPGNVPAMHEKLAEESPLWVVPTGEAEAYLAAGAEAVLEAPPGVSEGRNAALRHAWDQELTSVQLDDDLKKIAHNVGGKAEELAWRDACKRLLQELALSPFKLAGVAPTDNPYFSRGQASTLFVNGSCIAVAPCDLFFDTEMPVKEDYDYTLRHYARFGGALRVDDLLFSFQHYALGGSIPSVRTPERDAAAIDMLLRKWHPWVKPHPRRKNEVMLNIPRRKKVSL